MSNTPVEIEFKLALKSALPLSIHSNEFLLIKQGYFNSDEYTVCLFQNKELRFINKAGKAELVLGTGVVSHEDLQDLLDLFTLRQDEDIVCMSPDTKPTVRVRTTIQGDIGTYEITFKCKKSQKERFEKNIVITKRVAKMLFKMTQKTTVSKTRYIHRLSSGLKWEVDVFGGKNAGLVMAEVEVPHVEYEMPRAPESWVYEDFSDNSEFSNANLSINPFSGMNKPELVFKFTTLVVR